MKYIVFLVLVIKGVLLSAVVDSVEVKGVKIPVIYEEDKTLPIVSMQVIFKNSGALFDGKIDGLAKFTAGMLNEGSLSRGAVGFAKALEDNAINLSASTGNETFVFEISSLKEQFSKGMELFKELLKKPNLTDETLKKRKLLRLSAIERKKDDFDYIAGVNLRKILFEKTPLAHPFIGTKESVESMKLDDIKSFYKEHIVLSRAIVVVGGDISKEQIKKQLKTLLSELEVGKSDKLKWYETTKTPKTKTVYKDTKQAYIYFGAPYHIKTTDEDEYKAKVAIFILGSGGFGSRLMEEIRVKNGLAYSAYASANLNMTNSSFRGYLQTSLQNQQKAIELVKKVIKDFTDKGVTQKELESAKKFILGSEPLRNETINQRLNTAFMLYYKGKPLDYSKKVLEMIEKLKLDELNKFIKSHKEINELSFSIVTKKSL